MSIDKKILYKLELLSVKFVPIIVAFFSVLNMILYYFNITENLIDFIAGNSLLTTIPMYISSYTYKFCKYHRMFIHYIVVSNVICAIDDIFVIPLDSFEMLIMYMIVAGMFAFLALYYHQKYGDRKHE